MATAEVAGDEFPGDCISSRALAATAPLLGKLQVFERGFNTSHAEASGGDGETTPAEEDLDVAFSMLESWDHGFKF